MFNKDNYGHLIRFCDAHAFVVDISPTGPKKLSFVAIKQTAGAMVHHLP